MALNVLLNSNGIEFYCPSKDLKYEIAKDETLLIANDNSWRNIEIRVYSHDNISTVGLFTPGGTQVGSDLASYGSGSATKWAFTIPMDTFKMYSESGNFWELRLNDGTTVLAEFDLSVAILCDENGVPIIPIPEPDIVYDSATSIVESVTFNWFYFGLDGTTKYNLTDSDQVSRIIGYDEFCMQGYEGNNGSSNLISYMFREPNPEYPKAGGMKGNLITAHTLRPEIIKDNLFNDMSYSFGLNGIQCISSDLEY
jgi:hypothetical protein